MNLRVKNKTRIIFLAELLYRNFDMSFSRDWHDLPEYVRQHWLEVADTLDIEFEELYS